MEELFKMFPFLYYGGKGRLQGKIYNAGYAGDTVRVTVTWD